MPLSQEQIDKLKSGLGSSDVVVPSLNQAFRRDPDQYAETLRLSKSHNLPSEVVERNLDEVKQKDRLQLLDLETLRKDSPKTTEYLNDPDRASVSSDDVENLSEFEKAFGKYQRPWWDMDAKDWEGFGGVVSESFMQSGRGTKAQILDAKRQRIEETILREKKAGIPVDEMTYPPDYLEETLVATEKNVDKMKAGQKFIDDSTPEDLPWISQAARAGAQSVVENLPGLALTMLTRKPVYGLTNIGALTHGRAYGEATVEDLPMADRAKFAALKTGVEVGTEVGPISILADMVGTKTFLRKAGQFTVSELFGEQVATGLETVVENYYNMDEAMANAKTMDEKIDIQLDRQLLTFGATLFGGGGQIGIAAGANYLAGAADRKINGDLKKVGQSLHEQQLLDTAITLAQSSKTRERAPEQYRQFVQNVGGDTIVTIPAEATEGLEGLPEYIVPGQDNDVGIELFMQDIAPNQDWITHIRPHIKIDPTSYSQVEMEKDDRADLRKIMGKAVKNKEALTEAQAIWANVKDQLVATQRQSEATAKMSAQLYPAFATVMSEKLRARGHDVSPSQVFQDMGFKVERMTPAQAQGEDVMNQASDVGYQGVDETEASEWVQAVQKFGEEGMTQQARMQRAEEMGFDTSQVMYHGTTHDITEVDLTRSNVENDLGAGFYLSNSPEDVAVNYAGEGPDLTNRIEFLSERVQSDPESFGLDPDVEITDEVAVEIARDRLSGGLPNTVPLYVKMDNPVVIGGDNETLLTYEETYDEKLNEYNEPEGTLVDFIDGLRKASYGFEDVDIEQSISEIFTQVMDYGEISASDLISLLKETEGLQYATDDEGTLASSEIIRQSFENAGYDGFIDYTVDEKFGSQRKVGQPMKGVTPDTVHYVAFHPNQVRSVHAAFDPDFKESGNILRQSQTEDPKDGRASRDFFSSVVTGMAGKSDTGVAYETVIQGRDDLGEFAQEYADHRGNFDDHIAFSIPGFKEVQMAVGNAVVNTYGPEAVLLDMGASEGSFGKSISAMGGPQTVSVDPNQQFDVVHEAMVFQFIKNDRPAQISRMKEMMKEDGVLVIEEKFHNDQWQENEARKDDVKRKYFQPKDMTEKAKAVLEGMNENMTSDVAIEDLLTQQFKYVVQFWDSGNFKGYMASDSQDRLATLVDATGDLSSDHATVETPRIVTKRTVTLPVETVETGEVVEESFSVQEISAEIGGKLDAYQQLLDCLRS